MTIILKVKRILALALLLAAFSCIFLSSTWTFAGSQERWQINKVHSTSEEYHELIIPLSEHTSKKLILNLRRLPRPEGIPVILSHAVVLNNYAMQSLGVYLWQRGFDVWMPNMRGHGNGQELSRTEPYESGDYHFDEIVTVDWPAIHSYIFSETHQKSHIIGYSMGGMTWQQYLSGVYKSDYQINQSDDVARERSRTVASFTALTVPEDLTHLNPTVKKLLHPLLPLFQKLHWCIPFTTNDSSLKAPSGFLEKARRMALWAVSPLVPMALPDGIINKDNAEPGEFKNLIVSQLSSPHCDYVSDLISWFHADYASRDKRVFYGENKRVVVPVLTIVGTRDQLAPAEYTLSRKKLYPAETKIRQIILEGFSHIDISFTKGVNKIGPVILEFLKNPGNNLEDLTLFQ